MAYLLFIGLSVVWGSNFLLMKKASLGFGPIEIGAGRVMGAAAVLGLIWWLKEKRWPLGRRDARPVLFVAVLNYAWPFSILPWLIERNGSAFIGMMVSLVPLLTILISMPLLKVYPSSKQLWGVMGGLVFMGVLMWDGLNREVRGLDLALALTIPLCYAAGNTYVKLRFTSTSALALSCSSLGFAGLILAPLMWVIRPETGSDPEQMGLAVACLITSSLLATGLAIYVFYTLIRQHGPLFAGMTAYLIPVVALLWGWLDHEKVTGLQLIALMGILGMVAIVQKGAASQI